MIKTVFAYAIHPQGYSFGNGNSLPWNHIPQDMKWFRESTKDATLIMGANTWKSLPCKLKDRVNVVLVESGQPIPVNKSGQEPDVIGYDLETVIEQFKYQGDVCIIGGLGLIDEGIKISDEVHLTVITPKIRAGFPTTHFIPDSVVNYINGSMDIHSAESVDSPTAEVKLISKFIYKQV